tara:strand:- start:709 stop:1002 length:294 start_codon:yes stop_codon:yes gene_type:complete
MSTVTYIFLATLFYVANPDIKENLYSYQVQFGNMEQCEQFFDEFGDKLLNGVVNHGTQKYNTQIGVEYLSCAKVQMDLTKSTQPTILDQKVMYKASE